MCPCRMVRAHRHVAHKHRGRRFGAFVNSVCNTRCSTAANFAYYTGNSRVFHRIVNPVYVKDTRQGAA
jgi:hypothetical protein